jgi:transposase
VPPTLIQDWKKHLLTAAEQVFASGVKADTTAQAETRKTELFEQIGPLKRELEWLKKKSRTCLLNNGGRRLTPASLAGVSAASADC